MILVLLIIEGRVVTCRSLIVYCLASENDCLFSNHIISHIFIFKIKHNIYMCVKFVVSINLRIIFSLKVLKICESNRSNWKGTSWIKINIFEQISRDYSKFKTYKKNYLRAKRKFEVTSINLLMVAIFCHLYLCLNTAIVCRWHVSNYISTNC